MANSEQVMLQKRSLRASKRILQAILPALLLLAMMLFFGLATKGAFFTAKNLVSIYEQSIVTAIAATAIAFIYTTGNIDISIGHIITLSIVMGGTVFTATNNFVACIAVTIVTGFVLLNFNGVLSSILGIAPMIAAISMQSVYAAMSNQIMGPVTTTIPFEIVKQWQKGPARILFFTLYFVLCLVIFHWTKVGRSLRFIGGNETCARTVGLNKIKMTTISYLIAGVGIGLAAASTLIRTGTVSSIAASTGTDVMLATVLGGMSIFGGHRSNSYAGVIGGVSVIVLNKGLLMMGVDNEIIQGIRGLIFILIVYLMTEKIKTLPARQDF